VSKSVQETISWKAKWRLWKFRDPNNKIAEFLKNGGNVEDAIKMCQATYGKHSFLGMEEFEGNTALNEGLQLLADIIAGLDTTSNKWDSSNAHLGVGDSSTSESASQTGLQGTNKTYEGMDSGYPTRSNQTLTWRSTFDGSTGNHSWQEFTVVNASDDSGTNLNRKVADKGTKSSGETWTLELQITFS